MRVPGAAQALASLNAPVPGQDYAHVAWGGRTVAAASATGQPGVRVFCAASGDGPELIRLLEAAGAHAASAEDIRLVRIENGKPRYGDDIRETSLPQETQQMHALSFNKGCYLGQEIVERIRAQGRVNKKLMRVELEGGDLPEPGAKTTIGGNEAEITSAAFSPEAARVVALAYVRVPRP